MARVYTNENFPFPAAEELRRLGHDVLTVQAVGAAGQAIPDDSVLEFAKEQERVLVTLNRRHFVRLHQLRQETMPTSFGAPRAPQGPPRLPERSNPPLPDLRIPVLVKDCEHHHNRLFLAEVDGIRKSTEETPSYALLHLGKLSWRSSNPIEETIQLSGEAITQTGPLILVPESGFLDVAPGLRL